ncbi:MAG: triose-phosphate isomerase [Nitrospirota bacterium]|nr:MAG: triose-phosphate isomerase [Nitrospirota bacterium]
MRPRLIAGNWKMHKTISEAKSFVRDFLTIFQPQQGIEVVMAPPFIALPAVHHALQSTPIQLAAQNLFGKDEGAFTGEISAPMLQDLGCTYVIIGHSERRQHFKETNELINQKIQAALGHGLQPIFCVGERLEEREAGRTESVISNQIIEGLREVSSEQMKTITIAYEPVWAIGTGRAATPDQAAEVHTHIRSTIAGKWGIAQDGLRILYGGSVTAENAGEFFQSSQINGALVGKACLNPESFARIASLAP